MKVENIDTYLCLDTYLSIDTDMNIYISDFKKNIGVTYCIHDNSGADSCSAHIARVSECLWGDDRSECHQC